VTLTVSNSSLKQSCSVSTSVTSALEVNFNNMRYINLHFYLLTFTYFDSISTFALYGFELGSGLVKMHVAVYIFRLSYICL